jgi:hypothetical protein
MWLERRGGEEGTVDLLIRGVAHEELLAAGVDVPRNIALLRRERIQVLRADKVDEGIADIAVYQNNQHPLPGVIT